MHILIAYGSNSSGTEEVAELVRDVFSQHGNDVTLERADRVRPEQLEGYDLVILGSCSWSRWIDETTELQGQLQEHMQQLNDRAQSLRLDGKKFAVFALGDSSYKVFCGAAALLEKLVHTVHGTLLGTPLKIDGYFFNLTENRAAATTWAEGVNAALAS